MLVLIGVSTTLPVSRRLAWKISLADTSWDNIWTGKLSVGLVASSVLTGGVLNFDGYKAMGRVGENVLGWICKERHSCGG